MSCDYGALSITPRRYTVLYLLDTHDLLKEYIYDFYDLTEFTTGGAA